MRPTRGTGRGWRVAVLVVVCVAGGLGAVACGVAWLLVGFMGTPVGPWEPLVYPAGLVLCLAAPVLLGRWLLGGRSTAARLLWGVGAAVLVTAALVAVSVLGAVR